MISFFKTLSGKLKTNTNVKTEQKQTNDSVDGKEAQKSEEDKSVAKSSSAKNAPKSHKSETKHKQLVTTSKKIELVGHYLKNETNQKKESVPVKPSRSKNASNAKRLNGSAVKTTELKISDAVDGDVGQRKLMNSTLDSIAEINGSNEIHKNVEQVVESCEAFFDSQSLKDATKTSNYCQSVKRTIDSKALLNSSLESNVVSGYVSIKDIDLKKAKCIVCLHLVGSQIHITVCSHIFCGHCLKSWLKYSQHCPECRTLVTSFGHSIRTEGNRLCVRSPDDYKVSKVLVDAEWFVDSLSAAYLFEAFLLNREYSEYLDASVGAICGKVSQLEVMLANNRNVQTNVNIRHAINEENERLEDLRQRKRRSEESYRQICATIDPQMIAFWQQVVALREFSDLN